jgi:hypothetical protein
LRIADCGLRIPFPEDIRPDNPKSANLPADPQDPFWGGQDVGLLILFPEDTRSDNPQSAIRNPQ